SDNVGGTSVTETGAASIQVNGLGGDDTLNVNVAAASGSDVFSNLVNFDGGAGNDKVVVSGTPTTTVNQPIYTPAPAIGQGQLQYLNAASATLMNIQFLNVEPAIDTVPAPMLTVNGTNGDDAINYSQGAAAGDGLVSVNNLETVEFSNKTNLV